MGDNSEIFERLRNIETTVARMDERTATMAERDGDHEKRIKELELESARRKGIMAVVAAIGGVVGSVAVWIVKHLWGGG